MKVENIELYYLSMPEILDVADGSQDALIVKVEAGESIRVSAKSNTRVSGTATQVASINGELT